MTSRLITLTLLPALAAVLLFLSIRPVPPSSSPDGLDRSQEIIQREVQLHPDSPITGLQAKLATYEELVKDDSEHPEQEEDHFLPICAKPMEHEDRLREKRDPMCGSVFVRKSGAKGYVLIQDKAQNNWNDVFRFLWKLRKFSKLPIEYMYAGQGQIPQAAALAELNRIPDLRVVDMMQLFRRGAPPTLRCRPPSGLSFKSLQGIAVLVSSFDHVMLLHPGLILFESLEWMFSHQGYVETGMLLFSDYEIERVNRPILPPMISPDEQRSILSNYRNILLHIPIFPDILVIHKSQNFPVVCHAVDLINYSANDVIRESVSYFRWAAFLTGSEFWIFENSPSVIIHESNNDFSIVRGTFFAAKGEEARPDGPTVLDLFERTSGYEKPGRLLFGRYFLDQISMCKKDRLSVVGTGGMAAQHKENPKFSMVVRKYEFSIPSSRNGGTREDIRKSMRELSPNEWAILNEYDLKSQECSGFWGRLRSAIFGKPAKPNLPGAGTTPQMFPPKTLTLRPKTPLRRRF